MSCDALPPPARDLCRKIPAAWRALIEPELARPSFLALAEKVAAARAAGDVYPPADQTFAALDHVTPGKVKVVIVGQDPYFGPGQANGLSFSVAPGVPVPPSLNNIYAELVREAGDPSLAAALPKGFVCPRDGDLTPWARRGVLLLNAILTVRHGVPGSHKAFGWQELTDALLAAVRTHNQQRATVYLLWGSFAQAKQPLILGSGPPNPNVRVLTSHHPSPASSGFVGNGHFAAANQFLAAHGRKPVDWRLPAPTGPTAHTCQET